MGQKPKFSMGVIKLKKVHNHVLWYNPIQQGFNITEIVFCRQADFHNKLIGAFNNFSGIVTGSTEGFKDVPQLRDGVRKFFIDPGHNTESPIFKGVRSLGGNPQDFFPPGKAHASSGGNKLIIQQIISRTPSPFKFGLFTSGDTLKFRIIPDNIGKVFDQLSFHCSPLPYALIVITVGAIEPKTGM